MTIRLRYVARETSEALDTEPSAEVVSGKVS